MFESTVRLHAALRQLLQCREALPCLLLLYPVPPHRTCQWRAPSNTQGNSHKDSATIFRRCHSDADRPARAAVFPVARTEPPVQIRQRPTDGRASGRPRQMPVQAGPAVPADSLPLLSVRANFRFCIRPLPYSCRDTRWHRRHHQSSSSSDICFFVSVPGAPSDTFRFGNGGFSTSRWKTTSTPSRTNPSFSCFGPSAIFGIAMLPTYSSATLFTLRRPASSDDSPPRRTDTRTAPGRLHPADRQWRADIQ